MGRIERETLRSPWCYFFDYR